MGLCLVVKLNKPLALLGIMISPPPLMPLFGAAGIAVGHAILPGSIHDWAARTMSDARFGYGVELVVGSIVLAVAAGALTYVVALASFKRMSIFKDRPAAP